MENRATLTKLRIEEAPMQVSNKMMATLHSALYMEMTTYRKAHNHRNKLPEY